MDRDGVGGRGARPMGPDCGSRHCWSLPAAQLRRRCAHRRHRLLRLGHPGQTAQPESACPAGPRGRRGHSHPDRGAWAVRTVVAAWSAGGSRIAWSGRHLRLTCSSRLSGESAGCAVSRLSRGDPAGPPVGDVSGSTGAGQPTQVKSGGQLTQVRSGRQLTRVQRTPEGDGSGRARRWSGAMSGRSEVGAVTSRRTWRQIWRRSPGCGTPCSGVRRGCRRQPDDSTRRTSLNVQKGQTSGAPERWTARSLSASLAPQGARTRIGSHEGAG